MDSIRKIIHRERAKNLPTNPKTMEELEKLPNKFKKILVDENLSLYDSYKVEEFELTWGGIFVLSTRSNLKLLFSSETWFVDGTTCLNFFSNFSQTWAQSKINMKARCGKCLYCWSTVYWKGIKRMYIQKLSKSA